MTRIDPDDPRTPRRKTNPWTAALVAALLTVVVVVGLGWFATVDDTPDTVQQTQPPSDPTVMLDREAPAAPAGGLPGEDFDTTGAVDAPAAAPAVAPAE